jgi:hypothetical protein
MSGSVSGCGNVSGSVSGCGNVSGLNGRASGHQSGCTCGLTSSGAGSTLGAKSVSGRLASILTISCACIYSSVSVGFHCAFVSFSCGVNAAHSSS